MKLNVASLTHEERVALRNFLGTSTSMIDKCVSEKCSIVFELTGRYGDTYNCGLSGRYFMSARLGLYREEEWGNFFDPYIRICPEIVAKYSRMKEASPSLAIKLERIAIEAWVREFGRSPVIWNDNVNIRGGTFGFLKTMCKTFFKRKYILTALPPVRGSSWTSAVTCGMIYPAGKRQQKLYHVTEGPSFYCSDIDLMKKKRGYYENEQAKNLRASQSRREGWTEV